MNRLAYLASLEKNYVMQLERSVTAMTLASTVYSGYNDTIHSILGHYTVERLCVYSIQQKFEADDATKYVRPSRWHG